eukprot:9160989-Pyramimonas_sp.AAC.1
MESFLASGQCCRSARRPGRRTGIGAVCVELTGRGGSARSPCAHAEGPQQRPRNGEAPNRSSEPHADPQ